MKNWMLLLLLSIAGGLLWWLPGGGPEQTQRGGAAIEATLEEQGPRHEGRDFSALTVEVETRREEVSTSRSNALTTSATTGRPIGQGTSVEVTLLARRGAPLAWPPLPNGEFVEIMVRLDGHDEFSLQRAAIDAQGVARFQFLAGLYLEWVRGGGPEVLLNTSAFRQVRTRISAAEHHLLTLHTERGGIVSGKVLGTIGLPVPDLEVSAYVERLGIQDWSTPLANWFPGHYRVRTDRDGAFEFRGLPPSNVYITVRPEEWLLVQPGLLGDRRGGSLQRVYGGSRRSDLELVVTRRESIRVRVVDSAGRPAPHAVVKFEPIGFAVRNLVTSLPQARPSSKGANWINAPGPPLGTPNSVPLLEASDSVLWPYNKDEEHADEQGRLLFVGVAGSWRASARSRFRAGDVARVATFEVPYSGLLTLSVPGEVSTVGGRVQIEGTGESLFDVEVQFGLEENADVAYTDLDGRFEFAGVDVTGGYQLRFSKEDYFSLTRQVQAVQLETDVSLRPALSITAQLVDTEGTVLGGRSLQLVKRIGGAPADLPDPVARAWLGAQGLPMQETRTDGAGRFLFPSLYPGEYEIAFVLPVTTGVHGPWGEPIVEDRAWKTWTVSTDGSTDGSTDELVVNLTGYKAVERTQYLRIRGRLLDEEDGAPLRLKTFEVHWRGSSRTLTTQANGDYELNIPKGNGEVVITCPGYQSKSVLWRRVSGGSYPGQDLLLKRSP